MLTPSNRPRGDGTLDTRLGRLDESDELLSRRITRQKKAKAAGSGLVSMTVARCETPDNPQINANLRYVTGNVWLFEDNESGEQGPDLQNVESDTRAFEPSEAGWYMIRWRLSVLFNNADGPPGYIECHVSRGEGFWDFIKTEAVNTGDSSPALAITQSGALLDWTVGPMYLAAGEDVWPRIRYTGTAPIVSWGHGFILEVSKLG